MNDQPARVPFIQTEQDGPVTALSHGHHYGPININGPAHVHLGDRYELQHQPSIERSQGHKADFEALRTSLLFGGIEARMRNVKRPLSSTCAWLFQHDAYKVWESNSRGRKHNGFLWIKGKPGCGKSTVMKAALEKIRKDNRNNDSVHILHYFFNARATSSLEKSTLGLYRSLTYQILGFGEPFHSLFMKVFAFKASGQNDSVWTIEELQGFLLDVFTVPRSDEFYIYIDALDEGEHQEDVRQMIDFLVDLSETSNDFDHACRLRICLSSRHYPYINIRSGLSVIVEEQAAHKRDIETYVDAKLNGSDGQDREHLIGEICQKSASIFLWVVLVVGILNKLDDAGRSWADMRAHLYTIPADLDKLFSDILTGGMEDIETTIILFQWLLFATRDMSPDELFVAMAYSHPGAEEPCNLPDIQAPDPDRLRRYLLNCSRGLAEVTSTRRPVVQFIHETVREFLLDQTGLRSLNPGIVTNLTGQSHEVLKIACSRYMSQYDARECVTHSLHHVHQGYDAVFLVRSHRYFDLPFARYAVLNHLFHADGAQRHNVTQDEFLNSQTHSNGIWKHGQRSWWNLLQEFRNDKFPSDIPLLYVLAGLGLDSLMLQLLHITEASYINTVCGRHGHCLLAACAADSEAAVMALIEHGAVVGPLEAERFREQVTALITLASNSTGPSRLHGVKLVYSFCNKILFQATQPITSRPAGGTSTRRHRPPAPIRRGAIQ